MDKRGPHYNLGQVQAAVAARGVACFTVTALQNGFGMGLTSDEMLAVIAGLQRRDGYKSMTTKNDHRVWQDVYHAQTPAGPAYIKVTLLDSETGNVVIQFKELQEH